jgi:hypothetical protein
MIYGGYYKAVEKISLVMVVAFTVTTIIALIALHYTPFSFHGKMLPVGYNSRLPSEYVAVAFGAFGITGVASDEIIAYNYWCIEKGYAAYTGPRDNSDAWKNRARGWIKVMYLDATVAMIIYTSVTAAFYLLGAAILHRQVRYSAREWSDRSNFIYLYAVIGRRGQTHLSYRGILCFIL